MKKKIVVVGSSNTDMIVKAPHIPRPGETVVGGEFSMAAGGKGANQAVAAARAGGDVTFVARLGDDLFGRQALAGFRRDRIRTKFVFKDKNARSGVALICVGETGENSIAVALGANAKLSPADVEKARKAILSADILMVQLEVPLETVAAAIRIAAGKKVRVILNPAPARALDDDLLRYVSILTPNETETELLTGITIRDDSSLREASEMLLSKGIASVIITLGARGVYIATREVHEFVPAFKVKAIDTTAGGDVFNGTLAVALAERKKLVEAVRFANAAAAISVTRMGAQPSAPWRKEIRTFLHPPH